MTRLVPITITISCLLVAAPASAANFFAAGATTTTDSSFKTFFGTPVNEKSTTNPDNRIDYLFGQKKGSKAFPWNTPMPKDKADRIKYLLESPFVGEQGRQEYQFRTHRYFDKDRKAYRQQKRQGPLAWKISGERVIETLDIGRMILETDKVKKQVSQTVRHNDGRERAIIHRKKSTLFVTKWITPKGVPLKHTVKVKADGNWAYQTTNRSTRSVVDAGHGRKGPYSKMRSAKARQDWVRFRKR